jgi:cytochrome P450
MLDDHITHLINLIPKDRTSFDIQRLFFLLTLDSATHFLFGESVGCMSPTTTGVLEKSAVRNAQGFADAFTTAQDYLAARSRAQGLYWVINPKEFREANRRVHEVVDHYVNVALEAKRNPEKKQGGDGRYIFLEALAAETDDPKMLRDNMLNILLAGRDTTASLLSSTFFYLARYPAVFKRLRKEIVDAFGDKSASVEITQTKLKDIPYLRYVLNEGEYLPACLTLESCSRWQPLIHPFSPPPPTTSPSQLPRRNKRHLPSRRRRPRPPITRLRPKGHTSRLQRLRHAPPHRSLGQRRPHFPARALGRERQTWMGVSTLQWWPAHLSWS